MKRSTRGAALSLIVLFVLTWAVFGAMAIEPGGAEEGPRDDGSFKISEPAAIALLTSGLILLGIYAKHKQGSKK